MLTKGEITNAIFQGSCLDVLKEFPDESVNCCVTSPPYYALRNYGVDGQLGLESSPKEYINKLCGIFDDIKRVLRQDGTLFVNLGDTYGGTGDKGDWKDPKYSEGRNGQSKALNRTLPQKSLCQIPSRFAIEMTDRGWILRNKIIWYKPNAMPSSAKDRFTVDFEEVFFFTKDKDYWFDTQYEPYEGPMNRWGGDKLKADGESTWGGGTGQVTYRDRNLRPNELGRIKRCVWKVNTKPFKGAHFATFPEALIEPMIKAGCPVGGLILDPFFGAGTTGVVAKKLGRNCVGTELNPEYIKIAKKRIDDTPEFKKEENNIV